MNSPIILHLDRSAIRNKPFLTRDGLPVNLELALQEGFTVTPDDAAAILSLVQRHVRELEDFYLCKST